MPNWALRVFFVLMSVVSNVNICFAQNHNSSGPNPGIAQVIDTLIDLSGVVATHARNIDSLAHRQDDDGARYAALAYYVKNDVPANIAKLQIEIKRLKRARVGEAKALAECGRLRVELTSLNGKISELERVNLENGQKIEGLRKDIDGILGRLDSLTQGLRDLSDRMTVVEGKVDTLRSDVTDLQNNQRVFHPSVGLLIEYVSVFGVVAEMFDLGGRFDLGDGSILVDFGVGYGGSFRDVPTLALHGRIVGTYDFGESTRVRVGPSISWLSTHGTETLDNMSFPTTTRSITGGLFVEGNILNSGWILSANLGGGYTLPFTSKATWAGGLAIDIRIGYEW